MNKRINKLAQQAADACPPGNIELKEFIIPYTEKLAEMIVRECSEEIRKQGTDWIDWQPSQLGIRPEYVAMAEHLKKHFGVE
jgi:hypothetical protein